MSKIQKIENITKNPNGTISFPFELQLPSEIFKPEEYEDFELFMFNNYLFSVTDAFIGKYKTLTFLSRNKKEYIRERLEFLSVELNNSEHEMLYSAESGQFESSILIESQQLLSQLCETYLRLISSIHQNKQTNLFWIPYLFCNPEIGKKSNYLPKSVAGFFETVARPETKDKSKALVNLLSDDYIYIFFADFDCLDFVHNKSIFKKQIKPKITKFTLKVLKHFYDSDIYNAFKHGGRIEYIPDPIMNFHDKHGNIKHSGITSGLQHLRTWKINKAGEIHNKAISIDTLESRLNFIHQIIMAIWDITFLHNYKRYIIKQDMNYLENRVKKWWDEDFELTPEKY
jgi:hypothetical protein